MSTISYTNTRTGKTVVLHKHVENGVVTTYIPGDDVARDGKRLKEMILPGTGDEVKTPPIVTRIDGEVVVDGYITLLSSFSDPMDRDRVWVTVHFVAHVVPDTTPKTAKEP